MINNDLMDALAVLIETYGLASVQEHLANRIGEVYNAHLDNEDDFPDASLWAAHVDADSAAQHLRAYAEPRHVEPRVQIRNPLTGRWIMLDTVTGRIIDQKETDGPYEGVPDITTPTK